MEKQFLVAIAFAMQLTSIVSWFGLPLQHYRFNTIKMSSIEQEAAVKIIEFWAEKQHHLFPLPSPA